MGLDPLSSLLLMGKKNFQGIFSKVAGGGGMMNCEGFDESGKSRPVSTCCCLRRTGQ